MSSSNLEQMLTHLEEKVNLIKSDLPTPTEDEVAAFKSKLEDLKANPYTWKVVFPDFDERKSILQQLNKLKKKNNFNTNFELLKYLIECQGNN